ncbi:MAG: UDP-N-acetylglucosamine 2-epimerase [Pirellula sp.]|jgi:UDP-hydrolysing UDP-N-acetyl-D-glucosamine 2-epimerase
MRTVCVVITARPSYSRIKTALLAIREHPALKLQLVVAASALLDRYGNAKGVIENDGFEISAKVHSVVEGEDYISMVKTTGLGIIELATVFDNLRPDVVVSVADRYETLATAVAASYMNIPLVHIQGGEVTGSIDEKVRHSITKLADLHLVSTATAATRVVKMGEVASRVIVTGCPSIDIADEVLRTGTQDIEFLQSYGGVGYLGDVGKEFLVVLQHPVTTEASLARAQITQTLEAIDEIGLPTLWFWPNVDAGADGCSKGIRAFRESGKGKRIRFLKNMEPLDFLRLLVQSKMIIGNSSVAIRECSYLGVPAINVGSRQRGRERGKNVIDVGYCKSEIVNAFRVHSGGSRGGTDCLYGDGKAGLRVAEAIHKFIPTTEKQLTY